VLRPYLNAEDITQASERNWIVDFGVATPLELASGYEAPFQYLAAHVKPFREQAKSSVRDSRWWLHLWTRHALRAGMAASPQASVLVTPRVAKHRVFARFAVIYLPSDATVGFIRSDDYFFGLLQSRVHEVWARAQGTQLRERESGFRYTPKTCFETFPFPWPPGKERQEYPRVQAIAEASKELDELRSNWLNPPEWVREEVLEFPGSVDGPWARYVHEPDTRGIGTVRWPRLVPKDAACAVKLKARTLTNLYNERPTWLALAHEKLDVAVFAAYGWDPTMSDEQLLESLLALNLERGAGRRTTA
jgi:hypothetical protein